MSGSSILRAITTASLPAPEAAALLRATAAVGPSFNRGLLPRPLAHQAVMTGLVAASKYGIAVTHQSLVTATARRLSGGRYAQGSTWAQAAVQVAGFASGIAVQRALTARPDESMRRAAARTFGWQLSASSVAGLIAVGTDAVADRVFGAHTPGRLNAWLMVGSGAVIAASVHGRAQQGALDSGATEDALGAHLGNGSYAQTIAIGSAISGALYGASRLESLAARGVAAGVNVVAGRQVPSAGVIGHALVLGGSAYGLQRALVMVNHRTEDAGTAVEPAYTDHPDSPFVSGGPNSGLSAEDFGREGRRFINMAMSADEITAATGRPALNPIRAYSGLTSAETPGERAELAMAELERLGAFERSHLAVFSPTGTGYVNYVAAEALECMTDGDIASVAIQYSVRPSFLSLDRVKTAWESNLTFLTALSWRIRSMPEGQRPKLFLFGESLGSIAAQDVFLRQGERGFELLGIDRALFVGSPAPSKWRRAWLLDQAATEPHGRIVEVDSYAEWLALPDERRDEARVVLLTHHTDPIPKFEPRLLVQAPLWLSKESRDPGVPPEMRWLPLTTFFSTVVDVLNAGPYVTPGHFEARGHDYRADLVEFVRLAYLPDTSDEIVAKVETALRQRELQWAVMRESSAKVAEAEAKIRKQFAEWGIDADAVPAVLQSAAGVDPAAEPAQL